MKWAPIMASECTTSNDMPVEIYEMVLYEAMRSSLNQPWNRCAWVIQKAKPDKQKRKAAKKGGPLVKTKMDLGVMNFWPSLVMLAP